MRLKVKKKILKDTWQKEKCNFNVLILETTHFLFQVELRNTNAKWKIKRFFNVLYVGFLYCKL